jgi:hypothetical protein
MKKLTLFFLLCANFAFAQFVPNPNWTTVGGNSSRDGYVDNLMFSGVITSTRSDPNNTLWGMPIFTYGGKFVTSRYFSLSPISIRLSLANFSGASGWFHVTKNFVAMGFNSDMIYARDFQQNGSDTIYALNPNNGLYIWKSKHTVERGIIWTATYTSNGDLILPGSGTKRVMRINRFTGDTVWTNNRIIPNTGAECLVVSGKSVYAWQGSLTTPKTIIAIDTGTGVTRYSSIELPGDGDQEIPFTVSKNGVVYCIRDGGLMYAIKDNGTALNILWSRPVLHPVGTYTQIGIGSDSSVYIPYGRKIYRLNHLNGNVLDSSIELASTGTINPRFAFTRNTVFVGNGASTPAEGKYFCFSQNLQSLIWEESVPYNYYAGPAIGNTTTSPMVLMAGAGNQIKMRMDFIDAITPISSVAPNNFNLYQNYPNPFNPETLIKFDISNSEFVQLKIYDAMGKETETLVNDQLNSGTYQVKWNAGKYSSGVYYCKLISGNYVSTKKMMYLK